MKTKLVNISDDYYVMALTEDEMAQEFDEFISAKHDFADMNEIITWCIKHRTKAGAAVNNRLSGEEKKQLEPEIERFNDALRAHHSYISKLEYCDEVQKENPELMKEVLGI